MVVAGEGDATAVRMCSTKAANTDAADMSTTDEHGDNVGYCKNGADAMGVTTIDGVAVGKAADVEDIGGVVPKTEENTR